MNRRDFLAVGAAMAPMAMAPMAVNPSADVEHIANQLAAHTGAKNLLVYWPDGQVDEWNSEGSKVSKRMISNAH